MALLALRAPVTQRRRPTHTHCMQMCARRPQLELGSARGWVGLHGAAAELSRAGLGLEGAAAGLSGAEAGLSGAEAGLSGSTDGYMRAGRRLGQWGKTGFSGIAIGSSMG